MSDAAIKTWAVPTSRFFNDFDGLQEEAFRRLFWDPPTKSFEANRKAKVELRFRNGASAVLPLGGFMASLFMAGQFAALGGSVVKDVKRRWFFEGTNPSNDEFHEYLERSVQELVDVSGDVDYVNESVGSMFEFLSYVAILSNQAKGNTVNLHSLHELSKRNPEFKSLLNSRIPPKLQFSEIEDYVKERTDRITEMLGREDTPLRPLISSGACVNVRQLGQVMALAGLKPDLEGGIIPKPVNTSFLRGMRNIRDFMTNAIGARKALVTNFVQVSRSGYFARKLALLVMGHSTVDVEDCGTKHGIAVNVTDEGILKRLDGRITMKGEVIDGGDSKWIGESVRIRSPVTCAGRRNKAEMFRQRHVDVSNLDDSRIERLKKEVFTPRAVVGGLDLYGMSMVDANFEKPFEFTAMAEIASGGNRVFLYLPENLSKIPKDFQRASDFDLEGFVKAGGNLSADIFNTSFKEVKGVCRKCYGSLYDLNRRLHAGIIAILFLTNRLTQILLSSKHLLQTKSERTTWSDEFRKFFYVDRADVQANSDIDAIRIMRDDVDEDGDGDFFVRKAVVEDGEDEVVVAFPNGAFLPEAVEKAHRAGSEGDVLEISNITKDDRIFFLKGENIELTASLKSIQNLMETADHNGLGNNLNAICNEFLKLLEKSGISLQSVHAEMIVRALARDPEDDSRPPDFAKTEFPPVKVMTVKSAILNGERLAESLSFEEIKRQIANPRTFEKGGTSALDNLFV